MKKVTNFSDKQEQFILDNLKREWLAAERAQKRHEIVIKAKQVGWAITKNLFTIAAIGGAITIAAVAPGVFVAFSTNKKHKKFFDYEEKKLKSWFYSNKNKSLVIFKKLDDNVYRVILTDKGRQQLLKAEAYRLRLKKEGEWDGKWRIIIFDVPQKHASLRDVFRQRLKIIGMHQLQKSVFIYPYPCQEEIEFLSCFYNTSNYIHFIVADSIAGLDPEVAKSLIYLELRNTTITQKCGQPEPAAL